MEIQKGGTRRAVKELGPVVRAIFSQMICCPTGQKLGLPNLHEIPNEKI
jgi:hypothetical protein